MDTEVLVSLIAVIGAAVGALISVLGVILNHYYKIERQGQGKTRITRRYRN